MGDGISQVLVSLIWNLLFTGDEPMVSKAKPKMDKKKLIPLLDAGLVVLERRGRASHIVLTERAWQWAEDNLDAEFSPRANATPALKGLLQRLKHYLKTTGTPLAEVLVAVEPEAPASPADIPASAPAEPQPRPTIDDAIREAYLALSGGRWDTRVRLADLRDRLAAYPRADLDNALLRMQTAGRLVLYRLDDPQDTFDADRAAALYLGSDPRHLVYMKG
ncbi:MAG: hypothetical protein KF886_23670 [Candidatus Hydrogenedentes bacterium]|nr:hypothetical protein [Candidatus Hydrogenedentota bacterium]